MPRGSTTTAREAWAAQAARQREGREAERREIQARTAGLRWLIRAYVATGRDYRSPERLVLAEALRAHRDSVECDGWFWQWSRAEGDVTRRRADPVRKGAMS